MGFMRVFGVHFFPLFLVLLGFIKFMEGFCSLLGLWSWDVDNKTDF